jgi:hypothetical protein
MSELHHCGCTFNQWGGIVDECGYHLRDRVTRIEQAVMARSNVIEECARVCDEIARLQSEMADGEMEQYRKARAWDASVCAAKIRSINAEKP